MDEGGMPVESAPQDQRSMALLCWILTIISWWLAPLIFYLISNDKPFIKANAGQALTAGIIATIVYVVSIPLMFVIIGIFLMIAVGIFMLVVGILGAMAANRGEVYVPPITGGLAKSWFKV